MPSANPCRLPKPPCSARVSINETRFQYFHPTTVSQANSPGYALQVLGAFNGGGNPLGRSTDTQNNFEVQNNTSVLVRKRIRSVSGPYCEPPRRPTFHAKTTPAHSPSPEAGPGAGRQLQARPRSHPASPCWLNISSIESYQRTLYYQQAGLLRPLIRQLGGGASQFSINSGHP